MRVGNVDVGWSRLGVQVSVQVLGNVRRALTRELHTFTYNLGCTLSTSP